jgi:hypothetical protein
MLKLLSAAAEKAFAADLAARLEKDVPPGQMLANIGSMSVNRITRMLERTYQACAEYQKANSLGMIKRAVLANSFKWELKTRGYPDNFVIATEGLVVELSKAAREAAKAKA